MQDDRYAGIRALMVFAGAVVAALLIVAATPHKAKAASSWGLEIEADVGGLMTNDQLSSGSSSIDLSQAGLAAGVGAALMWQDEKFIAGVMGRYIYTHETGDIFSTTILSHNLIEAGAKLGVRLTPASSVFVDGGWAWKDMDLSAVSSTLGTKIINGPWVGGGIEHQIAKSPWYVKLEVDHFFFNDLALDTSTKASPDTTAALLGLSYKFGGSGSVVPLK